MSVFYARAFIKNDALSVTGCGWIMIIIIGQDMRKQKSERKYGFLDAGPAAVQKWIVIMPLW